MRVAHNSSHLDSDTGLYNAVCTNHQKMVSRVAKSLFKMQRRIKI
jgi:hypothetical protein